MELMDSEEGSLNVSRLDVVRARKMSDRHEEAVPMVEGESNTARVSPNRSGGEQDLPNPDVNDSIAAWIGQREDR